MLRDGVHFSLFNRRLFLSLLISVLSSYPCMCITSWSPCTRLWNLSPRSTADAPTAVPTVYCAFGAFHSTSFLRWQKSFCYSSQTYFLDLWDGQLHLHGSSSRFRWGAPWSRSQVRAKEEGSRLLLPSYSPKNMHSSVCLVFVHLEVFSYSTGQKYNLQSCYVYLIVIIFSF